MPAAATAIRRPRVLVIGMLDRQFQIVADEYPSIDFDHYKDGSHSEIDGACRRADHILVITKFISHSVWDHVPRGDPRVSFFSGLETLRRSCAGIAAGAVFRESQKVVSLHGPYCDYSPMRHAKPGDVLTFQRPEGVPAHLFAQDVHAARDAAFVAGVRTSCTIAGGRAEVTVTSIEERVTVSTPRAETFRLPTVQEQARSFWCEVYCESMRAAPYLPSSIHAHNANAAASAWLTFCGEE